MYLKALVVIQRLFSFSLGAIALIGSLWIAPYVDGLVWPQTFSGLLMMLISVLPLKRARITLVITLTSLVLYLVSFLSTLPSDSGRTMFLILYSCIHLLWIVVSFNLEKFKLSNSQSN